MKRSRYAIILTGGILNLLLALFHIVLCYQIYRVYANNPVYPLLQMLAIGGAVFIFFLAYTSLFCASDLISTKIGQSVIALSILTYLIRTAGEFIFVPTPSVLIVSLCLIIAIIYSVVFLGSGKKNKHA